MDSRARIGVLIVAMVLVTAVVIAADLVLGAITGGGGSPTVTGTPAASAAPVVTPGPSASQYGMVVQGRSGHWTNQTPLDLGYTDVWNLDGGMNAWQSSGRQLVTKNR